MKSTTGILIGIALICRLGRMEILAVLILPIHEHEIPKKVGQLVKNLACNAGDSGSIPGSGRSPREGNGNPLQYSCLENPYGQRCLVGYSPKSQTCLSD